MTRICGPWYISTDKDIQTPSRKLVAWHLAENIGLSPADSCQIHKDGALTVIEKEVDRE